MYKNLFLPAGLLSGTIIGAGIFALPYVVSQAGLIAGLFYLIIFASVFSLIHLMYADVILKTDQDHRISGYARIYLGKIGFGLGALVAVVGALFVLLIYLVLSSSFMNLIFPGVPSSAAIILFWLVASLPIFFSIRRMGFCEILVAGGITVIAFAIFFNGLGGLSKMQIPAFDYKNLFLPYGAALFALAGGVAIPAIRDYFRKSNLPGRLMKKPIILGTFLPAAVYFIFILGVLGASKIVSYDSVSGLIGLAPQPILWLLGILGLISIWSTYIVIIQQLKYGLELDFGVPKILAFSIAIFFPLILYFFGLNNFIGLIVLTGAVFTGLESILIILIWLRAKKLKPQSEIFEKLSPAIAYILILVFIGGMIYKLVY